MDATPARKVESVEELVGEVGIELLAVHPFKLSVERGDDFDGNVPDPLDVKHQEELKFALSPTRIAVRLITRLNLEGVGTAEIDYAAEYDVAEPVELSLEAFEGFVNRVAVMAIWPFTRQAAQDLFLRAAEYAITLPVIGPNDFQFADGVDGADEVAED